MSADPHDPQTLAYWWNALRTVQCELHYASSDMLACANGAIAMYRAATRREAEAVEKLKAAFATPGALTPAAEPDEFPLL